MLPLKPGHDRIGRLCAGYLVHHLPFLQKIKDRYPPHCKPRRQLPVLLGIDLDHCGTSCELFRHCPHRRCE
jgi:hypothetical protein